MNAAAWPPLDPTERNVTAGFVVAVVAFEYSVATAVAPFSMYRSAVPWNWIVLADDARSRGRARVDLEVRFVDVAAGR